MTCRNCHRPFKGESGRKFCGRDCANKHRGRNARRWAYYSCERCGKRVRTKPRYIDWYRFCRPCKAIYQGEQVSQNRPRNYEPCEQCGAPYYKPPSRAGAQFCSQACHGLSRVGVPVLGPQPRNERTPYRQGWRTDLGHYCRSRWEANYARVLRLLGYEYRYEPAVFVLPRDDGTAVSYRPDFLVVDTYYIEVKGRWRVHDRERVDLFREQHPNLPLLIVGPVEYRHMTADYAALVPEWERLGDPLPSQPRRMCRHCGDPLASGAPPRQVYCSIKCSARRREHLRRQATS